MDTNITGEELANQLHREEAFVTEEYIICKNIRLDLQIILRNSKAAYCNSVADCKSGSDEHSPYGPGTICLNSRRYWYKITREEEDAGLDIEADHGKVVCKSQEDKWVMITRDDPRFCDGVSDCKSESDELCPYVTIRGWSKSANISKEQWEAGLDSEDEQGNIVCKSPEDKWVMISRYDPRFCNGVPECKSETDELCSHVTFRVESKRVKITREQWEAGTGRIDNQGNIVCKSSRNKWVIIRKKGPRFCDGVPDCKSKSDELCPYVTFRGESKSVNISREEWEAGSGRKDEEGNVVCTNREDSWEIISRNDPRLCDGVPYCKSVNITREQWKGGGAITQHMVVCKEQKWTWDSWEWDAWWTGSQNQTWLIFNTDDCRRCNRDEECAYGIDEQGCPPYVAPKIELPLFCSLVVLILGILFYLGWKAVTRAVVDEAKEMEIMGVIGRQLEEAVDLIVEAAIEDKPFPEASYEVVYGHCGGIDLLVGAAFSFPLEPIARHRLARAFQLLEYQMIWWVCRFDTLGKLVSAHRAGVNTTQEHCGYRRYYNQGLSHHCALVVAVRGGPLT